ncbi:MAG: hypothetical protein WAT93_06135 [Pontixanthobacter sp.]
MAKEKNNRGIGAHWSFDSWAFFRPAEPVGAAGPFAANYGGSQAGAVLRYQLEPRSRNKANIYVRVTKALNQQNEGDIAAGLAARPIAALPVSTQAELRLSRTAGGRELLRPAALAVTEFSPIELPLGFRSEFYAQGGYVGGEYATAFADGQVRVDRKLRSFDQANLRLGAGAWGGAQKGVARLDIGPSASVDMPIAGGSARLAIDYRYRIAGEANPPSGIAITLSTGF